MGEDSKLEQMLPWACESDAEIEVALTSNFPSLRLRLAGHVIRGALQVQHKNVVLACYQIEIRLDVCDELGLPGVFETGGRIPQVLDRHINPANGRACLYLPEALVLQRGRPFTLAEFINGPIRNFFLAQALVERGEPFPFGEWAHGNGGISQLLLERFGTNDLRIAHALVTLAAQKVVKDHWMCPCLSGRRLRDCHRAVLELRKQTSLRARRFLATTVARIG